MQQQVAHSGRNLDLRLEPGQAQLRLGRRRPVAAVGRRRAQFLQDGGVEEVVGKVSFEHRLHPLPEKPELEARGHAQEPVLVRAVGLGPHLRLLHGAPRGDAQQHARRFHRRHERVFTRMVEEPRVDRQGAGDGGGGEGGAGGDGVCCAGRRRRKGVGRGGERDVDVDAGRDQVDASPDVGPRGHHVVGVGRAHRQRVRRGLRRVEAGVVVVVAGTNRDGDA
mmetsp:Transcript_10588/g.31867  ORF Transcript_10588/g.31867 Transcript_10588/m.31867 type:complete len:222 (-) Transcript_10588:853-1518(-)